MLAEIDAALGAINLVFALALGWLAPSFPRETGTARGVFYFLSDQKLV
jgi:hypothetical protein